MRKVVTKFLSDWRSIYSYNGGLSSVVRLLFGSTKAHAGLFRQNGEGSLVDYVTFSVVPEVTAIWVICLQEAIKAYPGRLIVGDSSGGFCYQGDFKEKPLVIPILNHKHGFAPVNL